MSPKVIKAEGTSDVKRAAPRPTRVISRAAREAAVEAEQTLACARNEVDRLRLEAERERAALRDAELNEARVSAAALLMEARRAAHGIVAEARGEVRRLAVAIAEKLLVAELTLRPEAIEDIVARALALAGSQRALRLRVSPADESTLRAAVARAQSAPGLGIQVIADEAIGRGGCVIESEAGQVDGRLEVQLEAIASLLAEGGE